MGMENMKKLLLVGAVAGSLMAANAMADVSFSFVELNYVSTSVDVGQFECWSECPGDQEPAGFNMVASYAVTPNVFVRGNYITTEDDEEHYDADISAEFDEYSVGVGYVFNTNADATSSSYVALDYLNTEFTWDWKEQDGDRWGYKDVEQDIIAVAVGNRSNITNNLSFDSSFAVGDNDYRRLELALVNRVSDKLSIKAGLSNTAYTMDEGVYYRPGANNDDHNWNDGDDVDLDVETFSLGMRYDL
jgi:hypothetical protein